MQKCDVIEKSYIFCFIEYRRLHIELLKVKNM